MDERASTFDVLGMGCVAVDDLLYVESYPPADAKVPVQRRERQCGGLSATALVAAARLGMRCGYAGVLGDDELSEFVVETLNREGVDTSYLVRRPGARPIHSMIVVDPRRQTKTIFYDLANVHVPDASLPDEGVIRSTKVLLVDHFGTEGMIRPARIARSAGIPVVADFETDTAPNFAELLALVDHLIVPHGFAESVTGTADRAASTAALHSGGGQREAVVVTCGAEGCWYTGGGQGDVAHHQPAFEVTVADTTGCGDVFHGAYAAALVWGLDLPSRVRFASAAAALKATRRGGQAGIPTRDAVEAFLKEHPS